MVGMKKETLEWLESGSPSWKERQSVFSPTEVEACRIVRDGVWATVSGDKNADDPKDDKTATMIAISVVEVMRLGLTISDRQK